MTPPRWRTGRKLGRTLYRDDAFVGMVDSEEIARAIAAKMNSPFCPGREALGAKRPLFCSKCCDAKE